MNARASTPTPLLELYQKRRRGGREDQLHCLCGALSWYTAALLCSWRVVKSVPACLSVEPRLWRVCSPHSREKTRAFCLRSNDCPVDACGADLERLHQPILYAQGPESELRTGVGLPRAPHRAEGAGSNRCPTASQSKALASANAGATLVVAFASSNRYISAIRHVFFFLAFHFCVNIRVL